MTSPAPVSTITLERLGNEVLRQLGDTIQKIWSAAETQARILEGYDEMCRRTLSLWDRRILDDVVGVGVYRVPNDLYVMERVLWDHIRIPAVTSRELEAAHPQYQTVRGRVIAYSMDKDGLRNLRKFRIPANSNTLGGQMRIDEFSRVADGDISAPDRYRFSCFGFSIPNGRGDKNTVIEFFRRGSDVTPTGIFEVPDRYVKYLGYYARHRMLERDGPGQDLELSAHFKARWELGIARMKRRKLNVKKYRVGVMGEGNSGSMRYPRPKLPWPYGRPRY